MSERTHERQKKFSFKITQDRPAPRVFAHACDVNDCGEPGDFRAPKSRQANTGYFRFCRDHAREYNEAWDYFKGMTDEEVQAFQRAAIIGHRPTWGLGRRHAPARGAASMAHGAESEFIDPFTLLDDGPAVGTRVNTKVPERKLTRLQEESLAALGLEESATLKDVKARYKELVKRFHPDANGGDRGAEERLKQVIKAYNALKNSLIR